jgi:nicotinate-nucleotide adenylyltransferase
VAPPHDAPAPGADPCGATSTATDQTDPRGAGHEGAGPTGPGATPRAGLGILGGSFNPPHRGHIALARHARAELGLERVLLMPARISPGKAAAQEPNSARPEHRLEMCRLAVAGVEGVGASALEIERDGPSYTVDTLRRLHADQPDIEITFILGADVARTLPAWRESSALPALARFAVALRAAEPPPAEPPLGGRGVQPTPGEPGPAFSISLLSMPAIDISSSLVRDRVRRGLPVEELVGPAVAAYIAEHGLYREADPREERGRA